MKTRGTNPDELRAMTATQLRRIVIDASLDVARTANAPGSTDFDIQFAIGTLNRIGHELRIRTSSASASEPCAILPQ